MGNGVESPTPFQTPRGTCANTGGTREDRDDADHERRRDAADHGSLRAWVDSGAVNVAGIAKYGHFESVPESIIF